MIEDPEISTKENQPSVEELTPEQMEQVVGGGGATGGGAGKVNVGDLAFTHHYDVATPRLT